MTSKIVDFFLGRKSEQGLTLAEMERPPRIVRKGDHVEVTVWNSLDNSSLAVSSVEPSRDGDAVVLRGTQSLVTALGECRTFSFTAAELGLEAGAARFAWADPDGTVHALAVDPAI
jgi:hypothetical protein